MVSRIYHYLITAVVVASFTLACQAPLTATAQFSSVRVQVIDRGQADGILIRTPNEKWVVIDAGLDKLQAQSMADPNIWDVDSVAVAFVSHRHSDHYGGMDDILKTLPVGLLVMNMADCLIRTMDDKVRDAAALHNVPTQSVGADTLVVDGVRFITLPPDDTDDTCPQHENDNSILIRMEFGDFSMLFTGDAETDEREWLMENHPDMLDVNVLKASHHGSINGVDGEFNGSDWMDFVDPSAVILTDGEGSTHGHPDPEAMDIYEPAVGIDRVYCTSRMGTIRIYGSANGDYKIFRQFPYTGSCRF